MNPNDPNLSLLESVARDLGKLLERFVFVGGCATGLLVTDVTAAPVRAKQEVDGCELPHPRLPARIFGP